MCPSLRLKVFAGWWRTLPVRRYLLMGFLLSFFVANSYLWLSYAWLWYAKFVLLLVLFGYCFLSVGYRRVKDLSNADIAIWLLFFLASTYSTIRMDPLNGLVKDQDQMLQKLVLLGGFVLVVATAYLMAKLIAIQRSAQTEIPQVIIRVTMIVVGSNLLLYLLGINLGRVQSRFSGWLDNPNTLGLVLLVGIPFLMVSIFRTKTTRLTTTALPLLMVVLSLLYTTGSRSSAIAAAVMIGTILWSRRSKTIFPFLLVGAFLVSTQMPSDVIEESTYARSNTVSLLSGREDVWEVGVKLYERQPYWGYGFGEELDLIRKNLRKDSPHQGNNFHNSYLSLLISSGLIGSALVVFLMLRTMLLMYFRRHRFSRDFDICMIALFLGFMVHGVGETWLFSAGGLHGVIFWMSFWWINYVLRLQSRVRRSRNVEQQDTNSGVSDLEPQAFRTSM